MNVKKDISSKLKTQMCKFAGKCKFAEKCRFAHSEEELRKSPSDSEDSDSEGEDSDTTIGME